MSAIAIPRPAARMPRARRALRVARLWTLAGVGVVLTLVFLPALLQWQIAARAHASWLGVTAIWPMDQLQYLAWIRDAGLHGLIRNLYGDGGNAVFVHPLWTPLALICRFTGLPSAAGLIAGQVLACAIFLAGVARLIRRAVPSLSARGSSVLLAVCSLGGLLPVIALLWLIDPQGGNWSYLAAACAVLPITALWAYAPLAAAVGLLMLSLERVEAIIEGRGGVRSVAAVAGLGGLISWLHPWQGEQLLLIGGALVAWRWHDGHRSGSRRRETWRLLLPAALTAAPLLYYLILSRVDVGWRTSARVSISGAAISWTVLALAVVPLVPCLLFAVRRRRLEGIERSLFAWPVATLVTVAVTPNGQYRAITGIAIPVTLLLARRLCDPAARVRRRRIALALAVLATLGSSAPFVREMFAQLGSSQETAYTQLTRSDQQLLDRAATLARGRPIAAPGALGTVLPAVRDARSWSGHEVWTPDYHTRMLQTLQLVSGTLGSAAGPFTTRAGIGVVLQPCVFGANLEPALAQAGFRRQAVGCGALYTRSG